MRCARCWREGEPLTLGYCRGCLEDELNRIAKEDGQDKRDCVKMILLLAVSAVAFAVLMSLAGCQHLNRIGPF
jgi:hypothetical protein